MADKALKIDNLDLKILSILDWEARLPASRIAKRVHSNKDVVASRIRKLEKNKVILQYYPILNLAKLGYQTHRLNFDTDELSSANEDEFVRFLDKEIGCGLIYKMDSMYQYGVYLWTRSPYDVENALSRIKEFLGSRLQRYRYSLLCAISQYPKDAIFGRTFHARKCLIADFNPVPYDEEDLKILRELAKDARLSTMDIGRRIGVPQQTVHYRMRSLEKKKVILGYRAEIVIQALGFEHYAFEPMLKDPSESALFEKWANTDPHVTWFETGIGGVDMDFVLEAKDRNDLERQLNDLRKRFPHIKKLLHYTERYWKMTYLP
jgi:Lrp/AsnC family transcriptional regulator, leucine-responsive regulatory protein